MAEAAWRQDILQVIGDPDDQRLVARLLNYWAELCGDRQYPELQDFNVSEVREFQSNFFVLAIADPIYDSRFRYVGDALSSDAGCDLKNKSIGVAPVGSLVARLASEFGPLLARKAPLGFEGEFIGQDGATKQYRGLLLPFSSNGEVIDHVVGAISSTQRIAAPVSVSESDIKFQPSENTGVRDMHRRLEQELPSSSETLHSILQESRYLARQADDADRRVRAKLRETLAKAYELFFACQEDREGYRDLLSENGIAYQKRAPFTPILKLVFGADYDKTRISEYAAALSYAERKGQQPQDLAAFLKTQDGGIKGCAKAEREERSAQRPAAFKPLEKAKTRLRSRPVIARIPDSGEGDDEFVLVLARRRSDAAGYLDVVSVLDAPEKVVAAIIRRAGRKSVAR